MAEFHRAARACHACKFRKKACDKALPACESCSCRKWVCQYDGDMLKPRKYYPGRHFVAITDPPSSHAFFKYVADPPQTESRILLSRHHLHYNTSSIAPSVHTLLADRVKSLLDHFKLSPRQIGVKYFQCSQYWLPIMTSDEFFAIASSQPPSYESDFAVLLLTMGLFLTTTSSFSKHDVRDPTSAWSYAVVKALFSSMQSALCASVPLMRAGVLLAQYEHACLRPDIAYVTTSSCAEMAGLLGLPGARANKFAAKDNNAYHAANMELVNAGVMADIMER